MHRLARAGAARVHKDWKKIKFIQTPSGAQWPSSCVDPEEVGGLGRPDPPEKSQKYRVS